MKVKVKAIFEFVTEEKPKDWKCRSVEKMLSKIKEFYEEDEDNFFEASSWEHSYDVEVSLGEEK